MDFIHLVGAEDVSRAGRNIQDAADTINRAANSINESAYLFSNKIDEFIQSINRLEKLWKEMNQK